MINKIKGSDKIFKIGDEVFIKKLQESVIITSIDKNKIGLIKYEDTSCGFSFFNEDIDIDRTLKNRGCIGIIMLKKEDTKSNKYEYAFVKYNYFRNSLNSLEKNWVTVEDGLGYSIDIWDVIYTLLGVIIGEEEEEAPVKLGNEAIESWDHIKKLLKDEKLSLEDKKTALEGEKQGLEDIIIRIKEENRILRNTLKIIL